VPISKVTRELAIAATRVTAGQQISFEDRDLPYRGRPPAGS
jgi:hypothetical protein